MLLFGDVASDFFPELQPAEPTPLPFALRGAKLAGQNIDSLNLDGESIPVVRRLLAGATFFDVKAGVFSLDERIVIRAPARMLRLLLPIERDEAFSRAVMLAPADAAVDAYVSRGARGGLFLVPHDVAAGREQMVRESLMAFVMYIVAMLGFLALVLTAFLSSARLTIRQEMAGFRIQAASGAAVVRIGLKIGSFVAAVVLFLPVALLSSLVLGARPRLCMHVLCVGARCACAKSDRRIGVRGRSAPLTPDPGATGASAAAGCWRSPPATRPHRPRWPATA